MNEPRVVIDEIEFWIGQKWRENDKRANRVVEVVGWDIRLKRIQIKYVRKTWAAAHRFAGSGYTEVVEQKFQQMYRRDWL